MLKETEKMAMWDAFKNLGQDALKSNHYILATKTGIYNPDKWKEFLMETDVSDYINQETALLQSAEFRKILLNTDRDNSAGRAQLINAMMTVNQKQQHKDGPIIIYSYIPLNEQQQKAGNIQMNTKDPFLK